MQGLSASKPARWWDNFETTAVTVETETGSSPRHKVVLQARIDVLKAFEFDAAWRYLRALHLHPPAGLPAHYVKACSTIHIHFARQMNECPEVSISGQNLFQPGDAQFAGDRRELVLIKRRFYAALTCRKWDTP
jgi:hypothetical protein